MRRPVETQAIFSLRSMAVLSGALVTLLSGRLRVVRHFSSDIVEQAKRERA